MGSWTQVREKNRFGAMDSIFPKLLLTFVIITIPMLTASVWLNKRAEMTTREQIIALAREQMNGNISRFDEQIQTLSNLEQYVCSNNGEVGMLANLPEAYSAFSKGEAIRTLNEQFIQIKLTSGIVRDVRIHLRKIEKTISSSFMSSYFDQEEYDFLMEHPLSPKRISVYDGRMILFSTSADNMNYMPGQKESTFFIVVELSENEVMKYMTQGFGKDEGVTVVWSDSSEFMMSSIDGGVTDEIVKEVMAQPHFSQDILTVDGVRYIVLRQESELTGLSLIRYINFDENFSMFRVYRLWIIVFLLLVLGAAGIFSLTVYRMVQKPVNQLIDAFHRVEKGDFNVSICHDKKDEFGYLYHRFDRMVENTKNLIEQVYEQKILSQRAELKAMQSQINSHFLYNSFFIISVTARRGDMDFVEKFTGQLGKYFQFIVKNDRDEIALSEEVSYAGLYADIQMTRFSNRITIQVEEVPEQFRDRQVPRLILQPLIENALAYGLERKKADGKLRVSFEAREETLLIYVEDNGGGIPEEMLRELEKKLSVKTEEAGMSGLSNIHRRLANRYGGKSGLKLEALPDGLRVILTIEF
ncbi:MAG: histidine kinase [Lachnospiraceae bacterium]|nr:histidine kinase [Lachnospiraceae bacterium]